MLSFLVLVSNFSLIVNCNFFLVKVEEGSWSVGLSNDNCPSLLFSCANISFKSHLFSFKFSNALMACSCHETSRGGVDIAASTW